MKRNTWIKSIELKGRELGVVLGSVGVFELRRRFADGGLVVYHHGMDVWYCGGGFAVSRYTSGIHLYVREGFFDNGDYGYGADKSEYLKKGYRYMSPVFMKRSQSRFILQVLDVRAERCNRISRDGIRMNGWSMRDFREHVLNNRDMYERGDWEFVYRLRVYWSKELSSQKKR